MTITQTVDVPADRRITLDIPREIPAGRTIIAYTPVTAAGDLSPGEALLQKAAQMTEAEAMAQINLHVEQLNREAEDVLLDQIDL